MNIVGDAYYSGPLRIVDGHGDPVTTLVDSDFEKHVFYNGDPDTITVTVAHLGEGIYQARFLPDKAGSWTLIIQQDPYSPEGWAEEIGVDIYPYPTPPVTPGSSDAVLDAITPPDFRAYFTRDFKYLPSYDANRVYFKDDVVSLSSHGTANFYKMLLASAVGVSPLDITTPPTWLAVSGTTADYVMDSDIQKAFDQARGFVNPDIFENGKIEADAYYYCTAHYLVLDIRMAESGLDSRGEGVVSSKSVGGVSVSYDMPAAFTADPQWAYFATTEYGRKFLAYIIPRLVGMPGIAYGWTTP